MAKNTAKVIAEIRRGNDSGNLNVGGMSLPLPAFFPAISSVKSNLFWLDYLRVLVAIKHPMFLVSAYDIHSCTVKQYKLVKRLLATAVDGQEVVLIDSGNYEKYWLKDKYWDAKAFRSVIKTVKHHLAFCYDGFHRGFNVRNLSPSVTKQVLQDQIFSVGTVVPIAHAPRQLLPKLLLQIVDKLNPLLIAVPERELGEGILERADTVFRIRQLFNKRQQYYPLHLLGTGNPLSMLVYYFCGADSFDGLEWCQTVVDHNTGLLYHFHQREFFDNKSSAHRDVSYPQATLVYNLNFYALWLKKIHDYAVDKNTWVMLEEYLPKHFVTRLYNRLMRASTL